MKKTVYYLLLPFLSLLFVACSGREEWTPDEDSGLLYLKIGVEENIKVTTRALTEGEQAVLTSDCKIRIYDGTTLVRKYQGIANLPSDGLQLLSGINYAVRVTAGDSVAASFDKKFYEGKQAFVIARGQSTPVTVVCKLANTLTKVNFSPTLNDAFTSYKVTIGTSAGTLDYTSDQENAIGYYMLPKEVTALDWTFTGITLDGRVFTRTGKVENVAATTQYTLTYNYEPFTAEQGGGMLTIDVDTTPLEENTSEVEIYQRPAISGMNAKNESFDVTVPTYVEIGTGEELSLWIATSCPLTSAVMSCDNFQGWGLPVNSIDLVTMKASEKAKLAEKGIIVTNRYEIGEGASDGRGNMGIKFSDALMNRISSTEGSYSIFLAAVDGKGNRRAVEWKIVASNATIVTGGVIDAEIWSSKATLRGSVTKEPIATATFRYRKVGTLDWNAVTAERSGSVIYANISGLTAGTKYEYQAMDGDAASSVTTTFTTEAKAQPENAGFENWSGSSPLLIYGSGEAMWWDSGNHGSSTMSKNVTTDDSSIKHSGNKSVKLSSQFVGVGIIGKFAAGNLFAGKYLKTDGTDGIIGWGRPFTSRPKALHGYIRYISTTVTDSSTDKIAKGDPDQGQVFIALGDWAGEAYNGETWPVVVKTKSQQLFDPSEANTGIIAYGEQTWKESTPGEDLIEFTIPLDYRTTSRKPTSLILVASASKYGDYFSGGRGSTMWIDDLELIYE